jgi:hypothetical protein
MKKMIFLLAVMLAGQVLITAMLLSENNTGAAREPQAAWLTIDFEQLDKWVIEGPDGNEIVLQRQGQTWLLPQYFNYPLMMGRLNSLIGKLKDSKAAWPKATTPEAAQRFKLAPDNFERKLSFYRQGQLVETLYLGSSPGLRKVYARKAEQNEVYAIALSVFDAPIKAGDWFDFGLLKLSVADVSAIEILGLSMHLQEGEWQGGGLGDKERINSDALKQWLGQLASMRFDGIAGSEPLANEGEVVATLNVEGKEIKFQLIKDDKPTGPVLKRSDLPYYFVLTVEQAAPLLTVKREQFISSSEDAVTASEPGMSLTIGEDEESVRVLQEMLN